MAMTPLSLSQQPMLAAMSGDAAAGFGVNVNLSLRFRGPLSRSALSRALALVMKRHEGLRMRLVRSVAGVWQRFVDPDESYPLLVIYLDGTEAAEAHIRARLDEWCDLEKAGPVRAELVQIGPEDHVLALILHHVVTDAYADDLFVREIVSAYDRYVLDQTPSLPPAMRFSDYVSSQIEAGQRIGDEQLRYWRSVIVGSAPAVPKRRDSHRRVEGQVRVISSSITASETRKLEALASTSRVSLAAVMYAVMFISAWKEYSLNDVSILVNCSGRDSRELQTLGAETSRIFQLRLMIDESAQVGEILRRVQVALIRGAISSRLPFTHARAVSQLDHEDAKDAERLAERTGGASRIHLYVVDVMEVQKDLLTSTPGLSVERIMAGPLLKTHFGVTSIEATPGVADAPLMILLRRDIAPEPGLPITFLTVFHTVCVDEGGVRALLNRIASVSRLIGESSRHLEIRTLIS